MAETTPVPRPPAPAGGLEKAAILLFTLGSEAAAAVFQHLSEHEVRQISAAIARLRSIPHAQAAAVHEEAWRRLSDHDGLMVDGEEFARQMIAAIRAPATGPRETPTTADLQRAIQGGGGVLAASLEGVAPGVLGQLLANEHPQVIALVLAKLRARQAALVLGALPEALQPDIVQRIVDLQDVPDELIAEVGHLLQGQAQGLGRSVQAGSVGGAKLAAEIMNAADEALEARVFTRLDAEAPQVAETIRQLMLTFEDLVRLDNRDMQVLLKEVGREELMLALKTASPALREKIFGNISQRAAAILEEDMSTMGPVRLKDVERAQASIMQTVRRLEAVQKIGLGGVRGDVVV